LLEQATVIEGVGGANLWLDEGLLKLGGATREENLHRAVEAMVASRFASIVAETESAILTELIGFKTFVESVEVG
jgi:hypothetical protein